MGTFRNEQIKITCLDYGFTDNVIWKMNKKKIKRIKSGKSKIPGYFLKKRLYVNEMNELVFQRVLYGDTKTYTCFIDEVPVIIIDLRVKNNILPNSNTDEKKYENLADFLFCYMALTSIVFTLVFAYDFYKNITRTNEIELIRSNHLREKEKLRIFIQEVKIEYDEQNFLTIESEQWSNESSYETDSDSYYSE